MYIYSTFQLIAVIFCCIALVLLICSVAGQEWVEVKFVHGIHSVITWGLWEICDGKRCFTAERGKSLITEEQNKRFCFNLHFFKAVTNCKHQLSILLHFNGTQKYTHILYLYILK